jgi:tetratricopeptide (TPR) repeat protein
MTRGDRSGNQPQSSTHGDKIFSVRRFLCGVVVSGLSLISVVTTRSAVAARPGAAALPAPPVLGRITFPTSGSPQAQPSFVQGVLYLHSFEYDDAIDSFRQAQKLDPGFAMAYWGEALAYSQPLWRNEAPDKARAVLARLAPTPATRLAKAPTAREKGYLEAVERLFGAGDLASRAKAYADRMGALHEQFPDDDEAAAFYALALLATIPETERNEAVSLKAGAIALAILKRNPEHPGANHYALHAFDDGEHAAMALEAARTYARIAPASSHARHMPSHVFLTLGMWDEAAASDESAFAASVDLAKRKGLSASQYDFHALSWLHYEYLQQGRFAKAREAMREVERAISSGAGSGATGSTAAAPHQHVESEIGKGYGSTSLRSELASMKARLVVESGDWALMKGQGSFENIDELYALGAASVKLGDAARAEVALEHLDTASKTVPDADAREIAHLMAAELDGLLRFGRGDRSGAFAALAHATAAETKRPKPIARPYPIKPAGELYGEMLLASGDAAGAMKQFQAALARTPRRAASLLGLARAAQKAGQRAGAMKAAKDFVAAWHLADADRPELAEMRALAR